MFNNIKLVLAAFIIILNVDDIILYVGVGNHSNVGFYFLQIQSLNFYTKKRLFKSIEITFHFNFFFSPDLKNKSGLE